MDQKEIDALINQGSVEEFNKKQDELIKNLVDKSQDASLPSTPPSDSQPSAQQAERKGKVMGQLSRVTEESEAGTNMVMGFLENVLSVISKQQGFINDMAKMHRENPGTIDINEALAFVGDNMNIIEELIFSAMDAFQFQDIGRQKLMKVMYTLSKLNEYLNELLGGDSEKAFGHRIEKKTLEQDKDKTDVDNIVSEFKESETVTVAEPAVQETVSSDVQVPDSVQSNDDVDSIIAQFNRQQAQNTPPPATHPPEPPASTTTPEPGSASSSQLLDNDDIDSLIAEYQAQNK